MLEITIIVILVVIYFGWFEYTNSTTKHGAPYVPLEPEVTEEVMRLAKIKKGEVFYELGSGDGRLVIAAALRGAKAYGIEIDYLRVLYSRIWIFLLRLRGNAEILHKNIFDVDLKDADIVCMYLLQQTNEDLEKKLEKELKKGARVISVAFHFPNWQPKYISPIGPIYGPIYYYEV